MRSEARGLDGLPGYPITYYPIIIGPPVITDDRIIIARPPDQKRSAVQYQLSAWEPSDDQKIGTKAGVEYTLGQIHFCHGFEDRAVQPLVQKTHE